MHEKLKNKRWISKVSISFQTIVNLYWRKSDHINFPTFVQNIWIENSWFGGIWKFSNAIRFRCHSLFILIHFLVVLPFSNILLVFGYAIESAPLDSAWNPCVHAFNSTKNDLVLRCVLKNTLLLSACITIIKSKSFASIRLDAVWADGDETWFLHYLLAPANFLFVPKIFSLSFSRFFFHFARLFFVFFLAF